jgi:acyl-CoA-binding protein
MADLQADFEAAVADALKLPQRPDNSTLLKMYGLYKQATVGDNTAQKPGFGNLVGRAKWDAWSSYKGTSSEDAKRQYVDLIKSLA